MSMTVRTERFSWLNADWRTLLNYLFGGAAPGGYTTLAALAFTSTFSGGASYYGIGDLKALVHDTHKFEARYLDTLVGLLPEAEKVYYDR